jgi:hypothetical protein
MIIMGEGLLVVWGWEGFLQYGAYDAGEGLLAAWGVWGVACSMRVCLRYGAGAACSVGRMMRGSGCLQRGGLLVVWGI